ncbi:hypothetical protein QQS21_006329 [Conoideocrella luteorostrata]|uniref:Heterokaryon incompatibility domain-containing protein n=1 Tax=Conoideocrella luteorostrata TaxID=1105319 RepID=A0AAJ0CQJ0_9HYPO|nr:hypothetical protein QQS21_006329 [Conoideocrella luteorostrata]
MPPQSAGVRKTQRPRSFFKFRYKPLDPVKLEIRVLELAPGKPNSRIFGKLIHLSLLDSPNFDALSYMWGPPKPSYKISINGDNSFQVGRNLRKALDDLRLPDRPRIIWTDAVCINQSDNAEKEHQVKLMRRVYSSAETVCAWIDHNVHPSLPVFEDLRQLGKGVEISDFADEAFWYPVADIFRNPYWRRLWIQQELILAKHIQIYCRQNVFEGQELLQFQFKINEVKYKPNRPGSPEGALLSYVDDVQTNMPSLPRVLYGGILRARATIAEARQMSSGPRSPAETPGTRIDLFTQSRALNMTDKRDRVYGILGLTTDSEAEEVVVDYSLSTRQVYTQVFRLFIQKNQDLSFLCFDPNPNTASHSQKAEHDSSGFPSWMPSQDVLWGSIRASRASGERLAESAVIDPLTCVLSAQGLCVDIVSFVGESRPQGWEPFYQLVSNLGEYCRRLWPDDTMEFPYEREHVNALLFPWILPGRYRTLYRHKKPTHQERFEILRDIHKAIEKLGKDDFSISDIVRGGYTPANVLSQLRRDQCFAILNTIDHTVIVGTEYKRMGSARLNTHVRPGDQVWVIFGCPMPLILRPKADNNGRYTVLGTVIIPGLMAGEALELASEPAAANGKVVNGWRETTIEIE